VLALPIHALFPRLAPLCHAAEHAFGTYLLRFLPAGLELSKPHLLSTSSLRESIRQWHYTMLPRFYGLGVGGLEGFQPPHVNV
jgi:hypothetical protein